MNGYQNYDVYYGDIHTHCNISYGHGSLEDALNNAREQLDFCSVTGHAYWPDMPEPNEEIQYIIDFHKEGFARLKNGWASMLRTLTKYNQKGRFLVFPGFEMHSNADGDRTVIYKDIEGEILYADSLEQLHQGLRELRHKGRDALAFPHHIGYKAGARGINWNTFTSEFAPMVEVISMHGCSETSLNPRPFLHSMGPADWESTVQYGLQQGHIFGFCGNTDHHCAHPGSYGHGRTGVWAEDLTREAIWNAFYDRRTYALTGDKISLQFSVNGRPMGSVINCGDQRRRIDIGVLAGDAIDYVDIIKDNRLIKRFSSCDIVPDKKDADIIDSKIHLELGWGERLRSTCWDVSLELSEGVIKGVEPRFRGKEIVSPVEKKDDSTRFFTARCKQTDPNTVAFQIVSESNPNNSTCTTQGISIELRAPIHSYITAKINSKTEKIPLRRLVEGAYTGYLGSIASPAYKFNRAALPHELNWQLTIEDDDKSDILDLQHNFYYIRVRQQNDQWAWSSPVFVKK